MANYLEILTPDQTNREFVDTETSKVIDCICPIPESADWVDSIEINLCDCPVHGWNTVKCGL